MLFRSLGACLAWSAPAFSAASPAQKCEATKLKLAGKDAACRAKALAKIALGGTADLTTCEAKLSAGFAKVEAKGGCATTGDAGAVATPIDAAVATVDALLARKARFVDNGDGTITDNQAGLQWEKKVNDPTSVHGVGFLNRQAWSAACNDTSPDGPIFTAFIAALDDATTGCFAGHCDWRVPSIAELESIVDPSLCAADMNTPCIDPIFLPTDVVDWSSTTDERFPDEALFEWMYVGGLQLSFPKCENLPAVRAVRTASANGTICQPTTCAAQDAACGSIANGCGIIRDCGNALGPDCTLPQTCGGGGVPNQCGCTPSCGSRVCGDDTCGGSCGACLAPDTCGGGGVFGQCGCTPNPDVCSNAGQVCGTRVNNCGQQVSCGTCPMGAPTCCVDTCVCATCQCP